MRKKYTPVVCLFLLLILTFGLRTFFVRYQRTQFSKIGNQIHQYVETTIARDQAPSQDEVQELLQANPRIALFVFDNQLENTQLGFINVKSFDAGATELANFYNQHSQVEVLQAIVQNPKEFANSYLSMEVQTVFRNMQNQKVKIGQIAIGYILPGYHAAIPKAGGYYDKIYKGWMIFLLSNMMFFPFYVRRRPLEPVFTKEKDLEWLEKDLQAGNFEEDTSRDEYQPKTSWAELFNQSDLNDWNVKGEWYVKEQTLTGFPWGGSVVTKINFPVNKFEFEVEGQRLVGSEGFAVLFVADDKPLMWMLGGWRNTRSEVIGYESTQTLDKLEKFRWYYIKIECDAEKVVGFLDGRKIWEISKKDLKSDIPDTGFQKGFGVGVWSSMARFQRVRIVAT